MASYRFLVQKLSRSFEGCEFLHVPRAENEAADTLAKIASSRQAIPSGVSLKHLRKPSVKPSPDSKSIHVPDDPAVPQPGPGTAEPGLGAAQLDPATIAPDPAVAIPDPGAAQPGSGAADSKRTLVAVFAVVTAPSWALPISEFLENGVLPTDETEARQVQRRESAYSIINNELVKRSSTGVFQCCVEQERGIDILLDIHQGESVRFIKDIAVRCGMPNNIITDNGTNFAKGALKQYCSVSGIHLDLASVAHPQSNGQVERANGLILSGVKPRLVEPLFHSPGSWLDELPASPTLP
ncbi:uncharacterized protein [Aegilops tauschii subsp. strangulata]|uniref:uncharacterized protein n=1 Tax=Aegilops tauschii subsp. strangulata TaxID=200361 RepID=UPI000989FF9A|nr:uncharacterized protein LOC109768342 [Aegilops tauschii subsp. strangulata]